MLYALEEQESDRFWLFTPFLGCEAEPVKLEAVPQVELMNEKWKPFAKVSLELISHKVLQIQAR